MDSETIAATEFGVTEVTHQIRHTGERNDWSSCVADYTLLGLYDPLDNFDYVIRGCGSFGANRHTANINVNVSFARGVSSSGWIDCRVIRGLGILVPLKVNGHVTMAYLYGGPSSMDTAAMTSLGLIGGDTEGKISVCS